MLIGCAGDLVGRQAQLAEQGGVHLGGAHRWLVRGVAA